MSVCCSCWPGCAGQARSTGSGYTGTSVAQRMQRLAAPSAASTPGCSRPAQGAGSAVWTPLPLLHPGGAVQGAGSKAAHLASVLRALGVRVQQRKVAGCERVVQAGGRIGHHQQPAVGDDGRGAWSHLQQVPASSCIPSGCLAHMRAAWQACSCWHVAPAAWRAFSRHLQLAQVLRASAESSNFIRYGRCSTPGRGAGPAIGALGGQGRVKLSHLVQRCAVGHRIQARLLCERQCCAAVQGTCMHRRPTCGQALAGACWQGRAATSDLCGYL